MEQKSIQEVDLESGLKAEESIITNTNTNIIPIKTIKKKAKQIPSRDQTIFERAGRLFRDRIRDQQGKKNMYIFSLFSHIDYTCS